ncbi:MAG: tetratricopeptide repeat protein [Candidatus Cloacimonetes bacterium]|nr:tetratricopeptide repeat protein [Candidatus Cloacimonadota bacterium]
MLLDILKDYRIKQLRVHGQSLMARGRIEKAYQCFQKIILMDNGPENQYNLALTLLSLGKFREAESYLERVLETYPDNEIAIISLVECKLQLDNWQDALTMLESLINEHPSNINYKRYYATLKNPETRNKHIRTQKLLKQALTNYDRKKFAEAITFLLDAIELDPDNATVCYLLGTCYVMDSHDYVKALPYLEKAVKLSPQTETYQRIYRMAAQRVNKQKKSL